MNIIKNDDIAVVRAMNAELEEIKTSHFTHLLKIKHNPLSGNMDCKRVNNMIKSHFDELCDSAESEDVYKIESGYVDSDGESGFSNESVIVDIEFFKNEIVSNQIFVIFRVRLSNNQVYSF